MTAGVDGKVEYAIMFDAGSSGSRIHVFKFLRPKDKPTEAQLLEEMFHQLKPGLSAYPTDPEKAAKSLIPLLDKAMAFIPAAAQAATPAALRATAGLRMLPGGAAQAILDACH